MNKLTAISPVASTDETRFMFYIKDYLEQTKPLLISTKQNCSSAFISFFDETYGIVSIMFYRTKGHIFNYHASSSSFTNLTLISSQEHTSATGKFKVQYKGDKQIEFYDIYVDKKDL